VTLCNSAPVFATIGFVVRLHISSNADTSWDQPEILLWATAELTSGMLCVCFPELIVLFRPKLRKGSRPRPPKTSDIEAWNESARQRKPPPDPYFTKSLVNTFFTNTVLSTKGNEQYIELHDNPGHSVKVTPLGPSARGQAPENGVVLRQDEVTVVRQERPEQSLNAPVKANV
jgi:hypothetical protein